MNEWENMIYISHLLTDEEMREAIEQTGAGVESIEFSVANNLDRYQETLCAYRQRLREIGCRNLILHGPFVDLNPVSYDTDIRRVTWRRYAACYEAARELGAKKVVYHSCMYPDIYFTLGWAERAAEFFEAFLRDRRDIPVVIENVYDRTPQPLIDTVNLVGAKNLRLCLDIGHAYCYGSETEFSEWVEKTAPLVNHVHVHDNAGDRDSHLALGEGTLPFGEVGPCIAGTGDRTYTIECSDLQSVLKSYEYLKNVI